MGKKKEELEVKEEIVVEKKTKKATNKAVDKEAVQDKNTAKQNEKEKAIKEFVEQAKEKKGFTYKDIVNFMGENELTPEELDALYKKLEKEVGSLMMQSLKNSGK